MSRIILLLLFTYCIYFTFAQQPSQSATSGEIYQGLQKLLRAGSVLYVAAHPDDENTRLLSFLANQTLVDANYISLTRGDGGQNLIGTEQGNLLGMIRTHELLAARKLDKAKQHFSRARDFGYSKTPEETFAFWNKDSILSDLVWVIRKTKPQLIVSRFPTTGEGGHGHHTASAILAEEAITAAADHTRFSWQLDYVQPWQAKRLLWNAFIRGDNVDKSQFYTLDIGAYNPLLGKSYGEIAAESRTMHKSQGFGSAKTRGTQIEYFKHVKGDSTSLDNIFEGVNFDISRIDGTAGYITAVNKAIDLFKIDEPHKIVPALVEAYKETENWNDKFWRNIKQEEIKTLIQQSIGMWFEAVSPEKYAVPGLEIPVKLSFTNRSPLLPVAMEVILGYQNIHDFPLKENETSTKEINYKLPGNNRHSTPFWLAEAGTSGLFSVFDPTKATEPIGRYPLEAIFRIKIIDRDFYYTQPIIYKWTDPVEGEKAIPVQVVPPATINFQESSYLFKPNEKRNIKVTVRAFDAINNKLKISLPPNWKTDLAELNTGEIKKGTSKEFSFEITAPSQPDDFNISAHIAGDTSNYNLSVTEIKYNHIPELILLRSATVTASVSDYEIAAKRIGYIAGAGDDVAAAIEQMGGSVTILDQNNLGTINLSQFDAIVTGIRAYNTNDYLLHHQLRLMNYVKDGGTLLVQYNTRNWISDVKTDIGPFPFEITRNRVTNEKAEVKFAKPEHKIFNYPNKLTAKDFEGWVQERGLYFASADNSAYEKLLLMNDHGEKENDGSLIIAKHGTGYFIYTGLSFFRQLPAGVPGAYRFFANLLSVGK